MVTYLPGSGAAIGASLSEIADAVRKRQNPNYEFQQAMQMAIATNPEMLKGLADLSKNAPPGLLENLGFGPLSGVIQSVPESAESEISRTTRPQRVKGAQQVADINVKTGEAALQQIGQPGNIEDVGRKALGLSTKAAADIEQAQSTITKAQASNADVAAQADRMRMKMFIDAPALGGQVNARDLAKKYERGELTVEDMAQIYSEKNPGLSELFQAHLDDIRIDKQLAAQKEFRRGDDRVAERQEAAAIRKAFMDSNFAGSIAAWQLYFDEPEQFATRLQGQGTEAIDQDVKEVADFIQRSGAADRVKDTDTFTKALQGIQARIRAREIDPKTRRVRALAPEDVAAEIAELNILLTERSVVTGQNLRAVYDTGEKKKLPGATKPPIWARKGTPSVKFVNPEGDEVDPITGQTTKQKKATVDVGEPSGVPSGGPTVEDIISATTSESDPEAFFDFLRNNHPDKGVIARAEAELKLRGVIK